MTIRQVPQALLYDSNIYLVIGDDKVALIDTGTGFEAETSLWAIRSILGNRGIDYIFLTHRHFDHVGGVVHIIERYHPMVFAGHLDAEPLRMGDSESTMGTTFCGTIPCLDIISVKDGDTIDLGGHVLQVIETPGHTIGSICLLDTVSSTLFSGDTLFFDGIGRTDLPTGSSTELRASLIKLRNYEFNALFSGHGPAVQKGGKVYLEQGIKMLGI